MNRRLIAFALAVLVSGCAATPTTVVDVDVHAEPPATGTADRIAEIPASDPRVRRAAGAAPEVPEPFVGTWKSSDDSILRLTETSFYLRFPHQGGIRENFGTIVQVDEPAGHIVFRYDRSLFNGAPTQLPSAKGFMTYVVQNNVLRKWIASDLPFQDAASEEFVRTDVDR